MQPLNPSDWPELVPPGARVFIGSNAACPHALVDSLLACPDALRDLEIVHILTLGDTPWADPKYRGQLRINAFFLGPATRESVNEGHHDYTPCFLSEVPKLFSDRILPLDVALIQVTPPDALGYCSFGLSVDVVAAACRCANRVIAQINPRMPRTLGDAFIHISEIDVCLEAAEPLPELPPAPTDPVLESIGEYAARLIEDGATLQLGIGRVPQAICRALHSHRHLGLHTEMFSDGMADLICAGVIDNSKKTFHAGESLTSFCMGSQETYQFVGNNPHIAFHPTEYVNNPFNVARNRHFVSINSAVQIDVTGQVAADSIGNRFYSGIGGHVDFLRGASLSEGGLPVIAIPSTACNGTVSRISACLTEGAGVVTTRADAHFVISEYGIATLRGRSIRERTLELVQIAHPDFREELLRQARARRLIPAYVSLNPRPATSIEGVEFQRVQLKDGDYVLRPLHPSDERRLQEFFYSHTRETIQQRYGYRINRMTRERASELVSVDQTRDLALGVFAWQGPRQRIHAVGRYYLDPEGTSAEMAFVVREEKRRHGLGSLLLTRMLDIAAQRKLHSLWAYVASGNTPMIRLFERHGCKHLPSDEAGMLRIAITVKSPPKA
ncbi:MAG: GNAT family N-acetyltransferase [Opitutales bacterium]